MENQNILLHSCCGPCSTAVLERLAAQCPVTVFFYNPNIYPEAEYDKRLESQEKAVAGLSMAYPVTLIVPPYDPIPFDTVTAGLEEQPEGGRRCIRCFTLRLEETARFARRGNYTHFTTTLSVSPHKDAVLLNEIGAALGEKYGVSYLHGDFKKRDGYRRSVELARELGLYRQRYCGCRYVHDAGCR
ncbi:MAG: epoxyqueuosine reductase QueH [Oscillospiraceae bacterium]|nr:epoxyqueuosine reductase QueH [Oscillospiraceae bacterium]